MRWFDSTRGRSSRRLLTAEATTIRAARLSQRAMRWSLLLVPLVLAACGAAAPTHRAAPTRPGFTVHHVRARRDARMGLHAQAVAAADRALRARPRRTSARRRRTTTAPWLAHHGARGLRGRSTPPTRRIPFQRGGLDASDRRASRARSRTWRRGVPVAAIGYSRGGRLVMDYASVSSVTGLVPGRDPQRVPVRDHGSHCSTSARSTGHTKVLILAGDSDTTVGNDRRGPARHPARGERLPVLRTCSFETVRSHGVVRRRPPVGARTIRPARAGRSGRAPIASSHRSL